jgi:hypothetical protein
MLLYYDYQIRRLQFTEFSISITNRKRKSRGGHLVRKFFTALAVFGILGVEAKNLARWYVV